MGVGVVIGYIHSFALVVSVFRECFGCFEVGGRSCRTCRFVISSKRVAPGGIFFGGGWEGNDNRQNLRLEGKLEPGTPGLLGYVNPTFSLPGETLHVTKLKSWFD